MYVRCVTCDMSCQLILKQTNFIELPSGRLLRMFFFRNTTLCALHLIALLVTFSCCHKTCCEAAVVRVAIRKDKIPSTGIDVKQLIKGNQEGIVFLDKSQYQNLTQSGHLIKHPLERFQVDYCHHIYGVSKSG
jgi:hypothetical protein